MAYRKALAAAVLASGASANLLDLGASADVLGLNAAATAGVGLASGVAATAGINLGGTPTTTATSLATSSITTCGKSCPAPPNPGGCREKCFLSALADICVNDSPECRCQNKVLLEAKVSACVDLVPLNVCVDLDLDLFSSTWDKSCSCIESAAESCSATAEGSAMSVFSTAWTITSPSPSATPAISDAGSVDPVGPMTTSTIQSTRVRTTTSAGQEHTVTETVDVSTTVCPVAEASSSSAAAASSSTAEAPSAPATPSPATTSEVGGLTSPAASGYTTSTVRSTRVHTTTSGTQEHTVTETVDVSTTVCPIAEASSSAAEASSSPAAEPSTVYQTDEFTITSCGPEVTNCPARSHSATATPSASSPAEVTTTPSPSVSVDVPSYTPAPSSPASASVDVPSMTPATSAESQTPSASVDVPSMTPTPSAESQTPSASVDVPSYTPAPSTTPAAMLTMYTTEIQTVTDCSCTASSSGVSSSVGGVTGTPAFGGPKHTPKGTPPDVHFSTVTMKAIPSPVSFNGTFYRPNNGSIVHFSNPAVSGSASASVPVDAATASRVFATASGTPSPTPHYTGVATKGSVNVVVGLIAGVAAAVALF